MSDEDDDPMTTNFWGTVPIHEDEEMEELDEEIRRIEEKKEKFKPSHIRKPMGARAPTPFPNTSVTTVSCNICEESYSEDVVPRILRKCGHTVCHNCANGLLQTNKYKNITCPFDRSITRVTTAEQLKKNYAILEVLDTVKASRKRKLPSEERLVVLGIECIENSSHPANWWCSSCEADYCDTCFTKVHSAKVLAIHQKTPITKKPKRSPKCSKHPQQSVEYYCETDKTLICDECATTIKHRNHLMMPIDSKMEQRRKENESVEEHLKETLGKEQTDLVNIRQASKSFDQQGWHFRNIMKTIDEFYEGKKMEDFKRFHNFCIQKQQELKISEKTTTCAESAILDDLEKLQELSKAQKNFSKLDFSAKKVFPTYIPDGPKKVDWLYECVIRTPQNCQFQFEYKGNNNEETCSREKRYGVNIV